MEVQNRNLASSDIFNDELYNVEKPNKKTETMKLLNLFLLIIAVSTFFTACELVDTFVSPALQKEGNFVDKNRQWLIDNSPFYEFTEENGITHGFSMTFLEDDKLLLKECIDGEFKTETCTWNMRFSDRTRIIGGYWNGSERVESFYTGFCSPIIHFNEKSSLAWVQKTLNEKKLHEEGAFLLGNEEVIENFKFGGEDNTIELYQLLGYTIENPETGEVGLYDKPTFESGISSEVGYSFDNFSDKFLGWSSVFYGYSYIDEWGYISMCYTDRSPIVFGTYLSANKVGLEEYISKEGLEQVFACLSGNSDPCEDLTCINGTETTGIEGNCFCDCDPGWTGPNCDQAITALAVNMQLLAGDGTQGNADGTFGQLNYPQSMVASQDGSIVYIADGGSKSIRMVNPVTNQVTTLLGGNVEGYLDGSYDIARFSSFGDIALDDAGNIYVSDAGNHVIRKISDGQVTTYAGDGIAGFANGLASTARFNYPLGLLIHNDTLYVADNQNGLIRAIAMSDDPGQRTVSTYAGTGNIAVIDGANTSAAFIGPRDITYDSFNNRFLVTEFNIFGGPEANVRAVTATQTTTLSIDLPGSQVLVNPAGIAADSDGSFYLSDRQNHVLYHLTDIGGGFYATSFATAGLYQTAGNVGGVPGDSRLNFPNLLYLGTSLNSNSQLETRLYIANVLGQSVWYIPLRAK